MYLACSLLFGSSSAFGIRNALRILTGFRDSTYFGLKICSVDGSNARILLFGFSRSRSLRGTLNEIGDLGLLSHSPGFRPYSLIRGAGIRRGFALRLERNSDILCLTFVLNVTLLQDLLSSRSDYPNYRAGYTAVRTVRSCTTSSAGIFLRSNLGGR